MAHKEALTRTRIIARVANFSEKGMEVEICTFANLLISTLSKLFTVLSRALRSVFFEIITEM